MLSAIKKMNMDSFSNAWKVGPSCEGCSIKFHVFRKKRPCFFCKYYFCNLCILRRPDKKLCCRKCQILTARPLDRNDLLNLGTRDLKNYLSSRHISTNGCVEKEDLVNVLMRAVNNSSFHASSSSHSDVSSCTNSYPNSPHRSPFQDNLPNSKRKLAQSEENLSSHDGIRITGRDASDEDMDEASFEIIDPTTLEGAASNAEFSSDTPANYSNDVNDDSNQQNAEAFISDNQDDNTAINESVPVVEEVEEDAQVESVPDTSISRPLMLSDINSYADLEALSVKQLKELLMRNRTDFKGCIERTELIGKAYRLWNDYTISRKDMEKLGLDELCKICMDAPIECVFLECGHMATCTSCGKQLCECPICRQFVVRCVRTFKA